MMWKSNVWILLVCVVFGVSILATAGLSLADGVNQQVSLDVPVNSSLSASGQKDYFYFTLGTGYTSLTTQTYNTGTGYDFDLYIKRGAYPTTSSYDARGYTNSASETITLTNPVSGTYYVMANSYSGSGSYTFKATAAGGTSVVTVPNYSGTWSSYQSLSATGDKKYFSIAIPSGGLSLTIDSEGPASPGDFDLYVKLGALPTTSTYDGRGYTSSSNEKVVLSSPASGTYYIMVNSYSGSGNARVKATLAGVDATPPTISGLAVTSITSSGATITWTTNEPATSIVEYGTTTSYGTTASSTTLKTSHSIALTSLAANTKYYYRVKSADLANNVATSTGNSFTTLSAADTTPPTISSVAISSITINGAMVTWTTNEASSSVVEYGTTTSYGSTATGTNGVTSHSVALSSLTANTKYYYRVKSTDAAGNTATSAGSSFTTLADASGPIAITLDGSGAASSVSATGDKKYFSVAVPTGKATLKVETYNPSGGYDLDLYVKLGALPTSSSYDGRGYTSSSSEVITINNPSAGTYYIMAYSYSGGGTFSVKATSTSSTPTDITPPTISSMAVSSITDTGATVTWTTNEAATSVVEYGTTTSYGLTASGSTYVTSHNRPLTGLAANTKYYYRVKSADAAGNMATGTGNSFTTTGSSSSSTLTLDGSGIASSVSATADKKYFTVAVPAGKATLKVETYNTGSGYDIDLYVKFGSQPTTSTYDGRGYTSSSNEVVTITNPSAGTYHIMVLSYSGSGAFSVKASSTDGGVVTGDKLALVIGISDYKTINDLSYAHKDAQEWGTYLQGKGYAVTSLLNSQASEAAIYSAVDNIVANAVAGTKVVITFSGHGGHQSEAGYSASAGTSYDGQKDGHPAQWFAWDASGYGAGCILDNVFSYRLRNLASVEVFVFMDECRSGGMDEVAYRYTGSGYDANCGRYVAQGCGWNEYTYDASQYGLGAWTYWYLKWAIESQGSTTMESAFSIAAPKYTSEYSDSHPEQVDNYPGSYTL
ncbi:MAG: pre-peptidase C-terminal domain-containing protein [Candidatus Thermoplasmatota archaeon]|nr:hypothetical protein [Euryarchaeota archaeon]MBU4033104.1 pre-peptidase C-terminal domain-containing protein [Candidatus Thermoplasmatota archaeon]MBU4072343.1 pre-peptidase C-terminal domain-containing protein [Candidatus Thermoplasmatota archaeon]MBU4143625.1 pre-peptidase C-terminal domain-containing protein [Candidatus Thermoplasmatota archaeon]MBU4591285.1 pre-peptidase C-terminal domain-containing protein [Candidatus Thermoplasmatota archaeon]